MASRGASRGGFRGASSGSFRGSAPGGSRGGFSRGGGRGGFSSGGGRGGFSGGGGGGYDSGPPEYVVELGFFMHSCEGEMVCRCTNEKVPYFNAPVFLENKTLIGKVDEILGSITEVMFTIKCGDGVVATSFKANDKVYVGPDKLLPMSRFLNPPAEKRGGGAGGDRGGRGGSRGGFRGASPGGFRGRGAPGGFRGGSPGGFRGGSPGGFRGGRGASAGGAGGFSRGRGRGSF